MVESLSRFRIMNGMQLYDAFLAGTARVLEKEQLLNRINVFPVPDGDTGTNLAFTLQHILEDTTPEKSFYNTVTSISKSAIAGARGNSGIIFAQFLYGFAHKITNEQFITVKKFVRMVKQGIEFATQAIEKPVEGTIITVIREWGDYLETLKEKIDDFFRLLAKSLEIARKSLEQTPQKLTVLKKNNVVDAGAQGFVFFLEGILDFLKEGKIKKTLKSITKRVEKFADDRDREPSVYRYCVETIIEGERLDGQGLRRKLKPLGDSLVIAGGGNQLRIHLHTNQPGEFFFFLQEKGTLKDQKVDDMIRQQTIRTQRKWPIALVTDSVCDLPEDILDFYQVHVVPIRIHFGQNSFFDKVTLKPDRFYQLLRDRDEHPTTSHPGFKDFESLYAYLLPHYDSIIALHMSKQLSGTWNASRHVAEKLSERTGKKISVINSAQLSGSLGLMVLRAAEAIEKGLSHDQIVSLIGQWQKKAQILVSVKNLKYMVRGGRVSPMKGRIANLLNLTPIISLDKEGKSILYDKAFSQKGNTKKVMKIIRKKLSENRVWKYSLLHAHDPRAAHRYAQQLSGLLNKEPDFIIDISPAVGLSAGHGAVAVALMVE